MSRCLWNLGDGPTVAGVLIRRQSVSSEQLQIHFVQPSRAGSGVAARPGPRASDAGVYRDTFLDQVASLAERSIREATSTEALRLASQLSCESPLRPLADFLGS